MLNWLWFAKVIDKKIDDSTEEIIIDLKGEISIRISNNIYYFEKHVFSDNQTRMFAIIYPGHPKYLAFSIEIQDIINNSFDLLKCKSFQKIMKINA